MRSSQKNSISIERGAKARAASIYFYGYWFSRHGV